MAMAVTLDLGQNLIVKSTSLTLGRAFGVTFDHGDDFYPALAEFCRVQNVRGGFIPSFIAGFSAGEVRPHIHVAVGLKEHSATGHTSHLLAARVQFLTEMLVLEVTDPPMWRERRADLHDVPVLRFGH